MGKPACTSATQRDAECAGEVAIENVVCHQAFLKTSTNLAIIFHTWAIFDEKKGDLSHISLINGIGNDRNVKIFRELKKLLYL